MTLNLEEIIYIEEKIILIEKLFQQKDKINQRGIHLSQTPITAVISVWLMWK